MKNWKFLKINELKPEGWLRRQLDIQARGLSGHLDLIWPDVRDSAWIGGDREGWERMPYWLDGFLPLAYLTEDKDMQQRAQRYIDAILNNQKVDGWICPCADDERETYDLWAVFLICKVLSVYHNCTGDPRAVDAAYYALDNLYCLLKAEKVHLFEWGKFRWFEGFIALRWLYALRPEPWLKDLGRLLREQGADYMEFFDLWKRPVNRWRFDTHIVNIGMAMKAEAVSAAFLEEPYRDDAEKMHRHLYKYNGTVCDFYTGDECLSGLSAIQGTELCAVVEQAYSYEEMIAITGDAKWADRLERVLYNGLPATCSEDMWTHQYDQMANQIACVKFPGKPLFSTNNADAHCFGLEPNYGCCTANFNQGWPKFAANAFMKSDPALIAAVPVPMTVHTTVNGVPVTAVCETAYPFRHAVKYTITTEGEAPVQFMFRVPAWSKETYVNNKRIDETGFVTIDLAPNATTELNITFKAEIVLEQRPHKLCAVTYGPLVFSLPVQSRWEKREYIENGVPREHPYCDYDIYPMSDWNFAFHGADFELVENEVGDVPFSEENPPLQIRANFRHIPWGLEEGYLDVCAKVPVSRRAYGEAETRLLQPYGCTTLRMTEMPLLKK